MRESLEQLVKDLLVEVRDLKTWATLPTVLTKKRAARELGVSLSKLKALIRTGELAICMVGRTSMVPASEVQRIAAATRRQVQPARPSRAGKERRSSSPAEEARAVRQALKSNPRRPRGER